METHVTPMKDLRGYLKREEIVKLYNACELWRDRVLVRLLWKSGRRITELLQLKVKDIDFNDKLILWNIIKKKKPLKAWKPIDDFTLKLLALYINKAHLQEEHYIIYGVKNGADKPISRQRAFTIIRRLGRKTNINRVGEKKIHPHHFRHSAVVELSRKLKTPADVRKLQRYMEHSTLAVTEQYLQFDDKEMRELIED